MPAYALFDIGGTAVKCGVADETGRLLEREKPMNPIRERGVSALLALLKERLAAYAARYPLAGIGVSTAGVVDESGTIVWVADHFPGYAGTRLAALLEEVSGLPTVVANDANCAGLGEHWQGAGRGASPLVCLTIGTGVGGCVILDGRLVRGAHGLAGEVGFFSLRGGTLEEAASTSALCRAVAAKKGLPPSTVTGEAVFHWARSDDPVARRAVRNQMRALAAGIAPICFTIDPAAVVIGGGLAAQRDYLLPILRAMLQETLPPPFFSATRFTFARLGNDAGLIGALYCLRQRLKHSFT